MTPELRTKTSFWIKKPVLQGIRHLSIEEDTTMCALVEEALKELLRRRQTKAVHPAKKGGKK